MKYTLDQYAIDNEALNAAANALSAYVVGQGAGRLEKYSQDLLGITNYWESHEPMWEPVTKMMLDLLENDSITGMNCHRYAALLAQAVKKIKSMRPVFRKRKQPCIYPQYHRQPCYCGNMAAATGIVMGEEKTIPVVKYGKKDEQKMLLNAIEKVANDIG